MEDNSSNLQAQEPKGVSLEANDAVMRQEVINPFVAPTSYSHKSKNLTLWTTIAAILVLLFIALVGYILVKSQKTTLADNPAPNTSQQDLSVVGLDQLNLGQLGQLDVNGIIKVNNGIVLKPSTQPETPLLGQIYLNNKTKQLAYYDGTVFQTLATPASSVSSIGGVSGAISLGTGLSLQGNTLSAQIINSTNTSAGVTSLQGQSGAVILVGGPGITVNGTKISNSGVTKLGGKTGVISAGRGISLSGNTLLSTVSLSSASATLVVTDDGNGNYTISQVGSGSSGSVALGPAVAQTDASNFPSISIDKTGIGNLIEFSVGGVNRFVVGQGGAITTGSIGYSQITGLPQIVNNFTDGSSNTATGAITLGSGLALSGNTIINTATGGITGVNGTANQITANTSLGVVTLSLPQDIATNSTPQFTGITLTGLGNGIVQSSSGSLSAGSIDRNSGTLFTNQLSVANGGTGSNAPLGARTNLGAAASGANSDITSLSGLTTALSVGQGGTGNTSLAANGVLYGNGAGAISSLVAGGSGLCLTSTAGAPSWAACPGSGGVSSVNTFTGAVTIQGTTNQITVANNTGTITLSLPQDINTTSSPQFSSLTLTNNLTVQGATATIGTATQSGSLVLNDGSSNTATILSAALGQNVVYTLPDPGQATATICLSTGNCAGAGSGVTTGGGTNGYIPVFTASQNIENSTLSQSGSVVTASGSIVVQGALGLTLGTSSSADGIVSFRTAAGTHTVSLQAPNSDPASNLVLRLPAADGGANDCLRTNGSGVLSFGACLSGAGGGSGGVVSIDGLSGTVTVNNATGSGSAITIDDATTLAKGIASFSSSHFTVTSGAVSIATGAITSTEIANGTVTGSDIANGTVANANLVNSSLTVSAGTGLSGGGAVSLGGSTSLSVSYGSSSGTAVQGNTTLTCPSGAGNLTGGGTSITLGTGGTCADINTVANPTFATSVTTAQFIMTGAGSNGTLSVGNLGQPTIFTLPDPGQATATICISTGNCAGSGTGVTTSGGTTNAIAKFTGSQALGDSTISDNGTTVTVGANLNVSGTVTLTNDLTVANGGTGASTFTSNGIIYGNGTGALQATAAGATGECLLGNTGSAPTWGSCAGAAGGVSSVNTFTGAITIQGTSNQVTVSNNTGTITLSLPQDINTNSSPQFSNVTLTGNLTAQGGSVTAGTNTQAGTAYIYDGTSNFAAIQTAALGQNTTYTLPDPGVASVSICLSTGNCAGAGTGVTTAGGTTNAIAKFTGSQTLGDSSITDNGSLVTIGAGSGTFSLQTTNIDISSGGAISGVTGYAQASGNFLQSGVGTFGTGTGAVSLNGAVTAASTVAISTLGGADSATYLCRNTSNQIATCNTTGVGAAFLQGGNSFGATAVLGTNDSNTLTFETNNTTQATIAVGGAVTFKNSSDSAAAFQVQNTAGSYLLTVDTTAGLTKIQAPNSNPGTSPGSARLAIESNYTDSAGDESILDIGESALTGSLSGARLRYDGQTNTFYLSGTNAASVITALSFDRDVTNLNIGGANNATMNIGTATQTGTITLGRATVSNTISIGSAAGNASTQAINIGTSGTAGSTTNVTIGSTIAGTTTLQSVGGVVITSVGSADNATYLCRNSSNKIATCNTTGTGAAFVQGGNSFGATAVLGTNDSNSLSFETNNQTQATIAAGGATTFKNTTNSASAFQIQNTVNSTLFNVDTTTGNTTITTGGLYVNGNTANVNPALSSSGAGGTLPAGTYYYRVAAVTPAGYTTVYATSPASVTTTGSTSQNTITWTTVADATSYYLYRSTTGNAPWYLNTVAGGGTSSAIDNGTNFSWSGTDYSWHAYTNATSFVNVGPGGSFNTTNSSIFESLTDNHLVIGNYAATGGQVTLQGDSLIFEDTTGYSTNFSIANTGATLFKNRSNTATAFRIQNSAGNNYLLVDTTGATISVGNTGIASTIQIGNTTGAVTQTINIGNNATASSTSNITIGSTIGGTTTLQSQAGTKILTLGSADNTAYLCRNTSNFIATCNAAINTLQGAYDADADGGDSIIALSTADDGIIIRNPAASGSDSTYNLVLDQLATGAKGGLSIQSAGTGNLLLLTDTTATARDVLTIADQGITTFRTQTDNASGFRVFSAAGATPILNVDTSNNRIGINDAAPAVALDVTGQIRSNTTNGLGAYSLNCSGTCSSGAQLVGNWESTGYWGLGILGGSNDNTLQLGNVGALDGSGGWSATQNTNLILGGKIGIGDTSGTLDRILNVAPISNAAATIGIKSTGGAGGSIDFSANGAYGASIGYNKTADGILEFAVGGTTFGSPTTSGKTALSLNTNGSALFQNNTDSTTAVQIQNATGATLLSANTSGSQITINQVGAYSDEFNSGGPTAASRWSFVTNDGSSYTVNSGAAGKLRITLNPTTAIHHCYTATTSCLRLVQTPPTANFVADTKIDTLPTLGAASDKSVGIIAYKDASNFIRFEVQAYLSTTVYRVAAHTIIGGVGTPTVITCNNLSLAGSVYLKVQRVGDNWTLYYSTDGSTFNSCGTFTQALDLTAGTAKIGPFVENDDATAFGPVDFDYFRLDAASATILKVNGGATFQNSQDSTSTAFNIQNAAGTNLLSADTTNLDITVGGNLLVSKSNQTNQDWSKVSGTAGTVGGNSTTAINGISASISFNGNLYVGTEKANAAEIYRYDGSNSWTKVSGAAGTVGGNPTTNIDAISAFAIYNGSLYAGTTESGTGQAEVYRYDGSSTWTKVSGTTGTIGGNPTATISSVRSLVVFNGSLYAGTEKSNSAEIYRYDGTVGTWTKVSNTTAGTITTGGTASIDAIKSFAVYNNQLYAGTKENNSAEVYRYDGSSSWTKVSGTTGTIGGNPTTLITSVETMVTYNGSLYAGTMLTDKAEVYRYDGVVGTWTKVTDATAGTITASGTTTAVDAANTLTVYNGSLYLGTYTVSAQSQGEIYRYSNTAGTWTKVSQTTAGTIASGGTASIDEIESLTVHAGSLYAGTFETGSTEIYRYSDNLIEGRTSDTAGTLSVSASTGSITLQNSTNSSQGFRLNNSSGVAVLNIDTTNGATTFQSTSNTTSAFQIQNASGTSLLNADTTNLDITFGGNLLVSKSSQTNQEWTKVSGTTGTIGGGSTTAIDRAYSSVVYNGSLYIGTNKTNGAEIYRYDGSGVWTKVSPATAGTIGTAGTPTASIDEVRSLVVYNGNLYAGTSEPNKAEVYRYDGGTTWTLVSQTTAGTIASGGTANIDKASRMIVFDGKLYLGIDEDTTAEIYRYDGGSSWTLVSNPTHATGDIAVGGNTTVDGIASFAIHGNKLYAGTVDGSVGTGGEVYRYDGGTTWTAISLTPGTLTSGGTTSVLYVYGLIEYNGQLYASTTDTTNGAEVYRYNDTGTSWTKISQSAGQISVGGTSGITYTLKLELYNGSMYLSAASSANTAEVYRYDGGTTWTKISQPTAGTIATGGTSGIDSIFTLISYKGSLYAGTGETGVAEVYRYSDNLIEGRTSDTAAVFTTSASTGSAVFQNTTNSSTAFIIQNTVGDSLFTVDSTNAGNITLLGNNGGETGIWRTSSKLLPDNIAALSSRTVYANGYVYSLGGINGGGVVSSVYYAKVNTSGELGSWASTTSIPVVTSDSAAVYANGYIYVLGGSNSSVRTNAVYYVKVNTDGTLGQWKTTSTLTNALYGPNATTYGGYIYVAGGNASGGYKVDVISAKINPDGSLNSWTDLANDLPSARAYGAFVAANGYLYYAGGYNGSGQDDVYYSAINGDGTVGSWTTQSAILPQNIASPSAEVSNGYLYIIGGDNGAVTPTLSNKVYYTKLNSDGSTGTWLTSANNMPAARSQGASAMANGYLYFIGGYSDTGLSTPNDDVYYVSTSRVTIGANLDLVGPSGSNLADGGTGGQLTAGNTNIVGTLNVQDQANIRGNLSVGGTLTVQTGIYSAQDIKIGRQTNSGGTTADWTVTNATAGTFNTNSAITSVESMAVYNGSMYIGTNDSAAGNAEVYRYDENANTYTLVSSTGFGNTVDRIQSLLVYNGYLYAGTQKTNGAEVYRYDGGTTWTAVTGTAGTIGGNEAAVVDGVFGMAVWHGKMYIGTFVSGGSSEIYRYDGGSTWADLITTAGNICGTGGNDYVHELEVFQDQLYAATFGAADICRYDGGNTWTRVNAASGQIATGGTSSIQGVESMVVFNGALYAGTYNDDGVGAGHAEIYRYDGGTAGNWVKVSNSTAGTIASGGTSSIDIVATLVPYNGKLYAGTWGSSGSNPDKAEVYVFDPVANSWSKGTNTTAGTIVTGGSPTSSINGVIQMIVFNNKLYAGTGETNKAEVYKFSATYDQSYALKFSAGSSAISGTEQGSYFNEGSIYFAAGLQGSSTNDNSTTGSFVFSNGITTASGSYDVAEDYPTRDGLLKAGDVVSIDPDETGFVQRSQSKQQNTLVGVYSEKPGLRLSQTDGTINGGRTVPVALAGRVPVNVSSENGPIMPGDYLTSSSTPGYAMKATQAGPTIGKALGSFNGQTGKVLAFVNVSYYAPSVGETLQAEAVSTGKLTVQGSTSITADLNVAGDTSLYNLTVSGTANFEGDVTVAGSLTTQSITVNGHIVTGGDTPTIEVAQTAIQNNEISVDGNDTSGTITLNIPANVAITEGDIAKLIFAKSYSKIPKVVISPVGPESAKLGAYVDQKQTEFVLGVSTPPPANGTYKFNYFIVE